MYVNQSEYSKNTGRILEEHRKNEGERKMKLTTYGKIMSIVLKITALYIYRALPPPLFKFKRMWDSIREFCRLAMLIKHRLYKSVKQYHVAYAIDI